MKRDTKKHAKGRNGRGVAKIERDEEMNSMDNEGTKDNIGKRGSKQVAAENEQIVKVNALFEIKNIYIRLFRGDARQGQLLAHPSTPHQWFIRFLEKKKKCSLYSSNTIS